MNRVVFSSSVLSLLAVRLVEGVRSVTAARGARIHTDVSDDAEKFGSSTGGASSAPAALRNKFSQDLQQSLLGQQQDLGNGTEVPPLITEIEIFDKAIKSQKISETDRIYIQNTLKSEDEDILRAIQPKNPDCAEEMEAIIFQHLQIQKDLHRAGIGPDDSLRADEKDIRRLITEGMSSLATAVLLDAEAKATADEGADTATQTQREIMMRVNARQNYQNLFKKNWILNQSITGQQEKDADEAMKDIIDKLANQVRKILVDTTDGDFLDKIEQVEEFRAAFGGMYQVGETLFVKSCPDLRIVQKFLHVFLSEAGDAPEDAIPDVETSILPYLLASTIVEFRTEFQQWAELAGTPNKDHKGLTPSFANGIPAAVQELGTTMTEERADRLIEPIKQFLEAVKSNDFEIFRTTPEDRQDESNKDFTIKIGEYKITKSYWDLREVARSLGHIHCCSNQHGFPGWWSYKFFWGESGWKSIADRLNGWAQVKESKDALVQEFREEFIESRRDVILKEIYEKIHNARIADWQEEVRRGAPSRFDTEEDELPQSVSDDERHSFSTAELIDEGVEGF